MLFSFWLLFGFVCILIANSKERSGCGWFLLGCLIGPFALVVALLPSLKKDFNTPDPSTHARCPHCAEVIMKEANVCKHCGGKINGNYRRL